MLEAGRITAGRQTERVLGQGGKKGPSWSRYIFRKTHVSVLSCGTGPGELHSTLSPLSQNGGSAHSLGEKGQKLKVCTPPTLVFHPRPTKILQKEKEVGDTG